MCKCVCHTYPMAKTNTAPKFRLTITLADGTSHSEEVAVMPRNWKSYVMARMPYATNFLGAKCTRERI